MPGGNGLYRQTWLSGAHAQDTPQRVVVTTRFTDDREPYERVFVVPPAMRWTLNLDDLRPGFSSMVDAVTRIECDGECWADSAIYFAPISRGVAATIRPILFRCAPALP